MVEALVATECALHMRPRCSRPQCVSPLSLGRLAEVVDGPLPHSSKLPNVHNFVNVHNDTTAEHEDFKLRYWVGARGRVCRELRAKAISR